MGAVADSLEASIGADLVKRSIGVLERRRSRISGSWKVSPPTRQMWGLTDTRRSPGDEDR